MLILAYHRVNPGAKDGLSVTPGMLEDQLNYLDSQGWENVVVGEEVSSGVQSERAKEFAITFDDGYQDNLFHALPVLERLGMRATVFAATAYTDSGQAFPWVSESSLGKALEREDLPLAWSQLKDMVQSGFFSVGSHTLTHPFLSRLDREQAYMEIRGSKEVLEERLGVPISVFCYPAGDFKEETVELVAKAGYTAALVTPNRFIPATPLTMHRVGIYRNTTLAAFKVKTSSIVGRALKSRSSWWFKGQLHRVYHRRNTRTMPGP